MSIMEKLKINIVELNHMETIEIHCALVSLINAKLKMLKENPNEPVHSKDWHLNSAEKLIVLANKVGLKFGLNTVDQEYKFVELKRSLKTD